MDILSAALKVVEGIAKHAAHAVANVEECKSLASLAEQTKPFLHALEQHPLDDPSLLEALDLVLDAVNEADKAIERCCTSTYLAAMVCASKNSEMLKQASQKLEHALNQLPLASLPITTEMHERILELTEHLRRAKFDSVAVSTNQTRKLREELEKAFHENRKGTEEMKSIIVDMIKEHSSTVEARLQDLDVFKRYIEEARREKDTQHEFELQQIIDVVSESIDEKERAASLQLSNEIRGHLCCPISKEVMKDPVVLKDSGVTYDRASVVEWMRRGHREDPTTKIEIRYGELIPNRAVKSMVRSMLGIEGPAGRQMANKDEQLLKPGLYEGHGQLKGANGIVEFFHLVICLNPKRSVQGYMFCAIKNRDREDGHIIVNGEWDVSSRRLSFTNGSYQYKGNLHAVASIHAAFQLVGERMWRTALYGDFMYPQIMPPPFQYHFLLRPGPLEAEGIIFAANGKEYRNKMVLWLQENSDLSGWLSIEESPNSSRVGNVLEGQWSIDGEVFLFLSFPLSANEPLDVLTAHTNFLAKYKLDGNFRVGNRVGDHGCTIYQGMWRFVAQGEDPTDNVTHPAMGSDFESRGEFRYDWFRMPSRGPPIPFKKYLDTHRPVAEYGNASYVICSFYPICMCHT